MGNACKLIAAKLAALLLVLCLLVAPLCAIRCATHACAASPSAENKTEACHDQASHHPFAGIDGPPSPDLCNPSELVLDLPRLEMQPASSPGPHSATSEDAAVQSISAVVSDRLDAAPPGWDNLPLSLTSIWSRLSPPLRI